jgi:hypothetical protein
VFANAERTGAVSLLPRARRADVAAQTSATQALALQHAIGNRATRRVLSRDISHTTGTGFTRNADRPSWMADIKRLLVHWYNAEYRKSIDPDSVNLTKLNADRCHRRSWKVVEEHLASFLNGHTTEKDFREYLSELYHPFSDPGYRPPGWLTTAFNGAVPSWYNDMQFALDVLIGKRNAWQQNPRVVRVDEVVQYANALGRHLFNAPGNLTLGEAPTNQYIKEFFDPNVVATPNLIHYRFSPGAKRAMDHSPQQLRWDKEGYFYSSQLGMRTGDARVDLGDLTPDSFDYALGK